MLLKVVGIYALVATVALAGSLWALKRSYEQIGAMNAAAEIAKSEVEEAKKDVEKMIAERDRLQQNLIAMGDTVSALQESRDREIERYNRFRNTLDKRTIAKPEVTERAARIDIGRRQCQLWRDTGGIGDCPR